MSRIVSWKERVASTLPWVPSIFMVTLTLWTVGRPLDEAVPVLQAIAYLLTSTYFLGEVINVLTELWLQRRKEEGRAEGKAEGKEEGKNKLHDEAKRALEAAFSEPKDREKALKALEDARRST